MALQTLGTPGEHAETRDNACLEPENDDTCGASEGDTRTCEPATRAGGHFISLIALEAART